MCENFNDIKLVLFSSKVDEHFEKISSVIPVSFPKDKIFHCSSIGDFSFTLKGMLFGLGIVIAIARNKEELNKIYEMNKRLKDHSVILVLSDDIGDIDQQAIRLYPRYTAFIKKDYNDVSQVLNKMIKNIKDKINGGRNGGNY